MLIWNNIVSDFCYKSHIGRLPFNQILNAIGNIKQGKQKAIWIFLFHFGCNIVRKSFSLNFFTCLTLSRHFGILYSDFLDCINGMKTASNVRYLLNKQLLATKKIPFFCFLCLNYNKFFIRLYLLFILLLLFYNNLFILSIGICL